MILPSLAGNWQVTSPPLSLLLLGSQHLRVVASWPWCYVVFYWINDAKLCLQWGQILSRLFVGTYKHTDEGGRQSHRRGQWLSSYDFVGGTESTTLQNFPWTKEPIKRRWRKLASIIYYFTGFNYIEMPKSDQSMYDLDYLFAYLELPKVKNPLFHQKWTCNLECEISGTCPDFHNKILKPF